MDKFKSTPVEEIHSAFKAVKSTFDSGKTLNVNYRLEQLRNLAYGIYDNRENIRAATNKDLGKSTLESALVETGPLLEEIEIVMSGLPKWVKPVKVKSNLKYSLLSPKIHYQPYGVVLVISTWNYPFELALSPVLGAIAAGNTVILKLNEYCINSNMILEKIIKEYMDPDLIKVIYGSVNETTELLKLKFNKILYTGNTSVAKIISKAAAENLTPLVLELGGKSPTIIDKTANLEITADRLVWGKYINEGQTCLAPDYLLIQKDIKEKFLIVLKKAIEKAYGGDPFNSSAYSKIINERHFKRIQNLLESTKGNIIIGGNTDTKKLKIEPTVVDNVSLQDILMKEELFAPILPVITYESTNDLFEIISHNPTPLSLYIFSTDKKNIKRIIKHTQSGTFAINDTLLQAAVPFLPFGGIGTSGTGSYHGRSSFLAFSHTRSCINTPLWAEMILKLRYPLNGDDKFKKYSSFIIPKPKYPRTGPIRTGSFWNIFKSKTFWIAVTAIALTSLGFKNSLGA